jgi:predicted aminopeptidase
MRGSLLVGLLVLSQLSSGCYYSHLASGQLKILWARQPIEGVIADPEIPLETRSLLRLVSGVREFASDLGLRVGNQYTSYVDWSEDRIVTTVVRTRPPSVEATPYWFPIIGHLPYKGYFDRAKAEAEAERLREADDFDVCVSGVTAYSTLGWMNDPVTAPMLRRGAASLVETLFHELVHATAFVSEHVDFNESVAQFIGQEAAIRFFFQRPGGPAEWISDDAHALVWPDPERVRQSIEDRRAIARTTGVFRQRLVELAAESSPPEKRAAAERYARAQLAALPLQVIDPEEVATKARLSNACLALRGAYTRDLPRHAQVLRALDGDLEAMIRRLVRVADEEITPEEFYRVEGGMAYSPRSVSPRSVSDELDDAFGDESAEDL